VGQDAAEHPRRIVINIQRSAKGELHWKTGGESCTADSGDRK